MSRHRPLREKAQRLSGATSRLIPTTRRSSSYVAPAVSSTGERKQTIRLTFRCLLTLARNTIGLWRRHSLSSHAIGLPRRQSRHFTAERQRIAGIGSSSSRRSDGRHRSPRRCGAGACGIADHLDERMPSSAHSAAPRLQVATDAVIRQARRHQHHRVAGNLALGTGIGAGRLSRLPGTTRVTRG